MSRLKVVRKLQARARIHLRSTTQPLVHLLNELSGSGPEGQELRRVVGAEEGIPHDFVF